MIGSFKKIKKNKISKFIIIIIIFSFFSILINYPFIKYNILLGSYDGDAISQLYPFKYFISKNLMEGNFFYSFNFGLGGDFFSELSYYYTTSPLFYFNLFLFNILGLNNGTFLSAIKLGLFSSISNKILSMLTMYILLEYEYRNNKKINLFASIIYGICTLSIYRYLEFDFMADSFVYLPLVCYGIRKFDKERKPLLFIISFGIMVMSNFYFAFMNCIFIFTFMMIYSFEYTSFKNFISQVFERAKLVILGFGISAIGFLPSVNSFFNADRNSTYSAKRLFVESYRIVGKMKLLLFSPEVIGGVSIFSILLIMYNIIIHKNIRKNLGPLLWIILFFSPIFSSFLNGMSYESDRWYYLILFSFIYILPKNLKDFINSRLFKDNKKKFLIIIIKFILVSLILYLRKNRTEIFLQILTTMLIIDIAFITSNKNTKINIIVFSMILYNLVYGYKYIFEHKASKKTDDQYRNLAIDNYNINFDDKSFFRISNYNIDPGHFGRNENTELLIGNNGTSIYNSLINKNLMKWFRNQHNIWTFYITPSYYRGFNDRLFLETIWGVKYKINYNENTIPYYDLKNIEGNKVYVNKHHLGLDFWYDTYLPIEDYEKLNIAEKDAALMQTAVLDEYENIELQKAELDKTVQKIEINQKEYSYFNSRNENGIIIIDHKDGKPINKTKRGKFTVPINKISEKGEYLLSFHLESLKDFPIWSNYKYKLNINGKSMNKFRDNYAWTYPQDDFTIKLEGDIKNIEFLMTPGEYKFSNIDLYFSSYKYYEEWTKKLNKYNLENLVIENDKVSGIIKNKENGILGLNIPYNDNWQLKINGKNSKFIKIDNALMGIYLEKGENNIILTYIPKSFYTGLALTLTTTSILIYLYYKNRNKIKKS